MKMTTEEAFVKVLQMHGIEHAFGIIGSAFMPISDLFPAAGITFWDVAHEGNGALICDGYTRSTGKIAMVIAQNGPGITNFVTAIAAAYWAHSAVVAITPETGSLSIGLGGFQETDQLPIFSKITKYQAHVNNPARMAELTARAFDRAILEMGPAQLNIPRDYFYGELDCEIPQPIRIERGPGGSASLEAAAELLAQARFPVIIAGGGARNPTLMAMLFCGERGGPKQRRRICEVHVHESARFLLPCASAPGPARVKAPKT